MLRSRFLLLLLSTLLAAALFAVPCLSLTAQPVDGVFRSWSVVDVASHPASSAVYLSDSYAAIRAVNSTTGLLLPYVALIGNYPTTVRGIVSDGQNSLVHALTAKLDRSTYYYTDYRLITLTADLKIIANVSLDNTLSPRLEWEEELFDTILVDSKSCVYIARQLFNSSLLVHVLQNGKQIDAWLAPVAAAWNLDYQVAMGAGSLIHIKPTNSWTPSVSQPLFVVTTGGLLVATLNLNLTNNAYYQNALAVSRSSGNIAISSGYGIALFTSAGVRLSSFRYLSPVDDYSGFRRLAFDGSDRLLAIDTQDEFGVQLISSKNGDLLGSWQTPVPPLRYTRSMVYERQSNSLLIAQPSVRTSTVVRLDGDNGVLLQEYPNVGRTNRCITLASTVGSFGNIYKLLQCADNNYNYNTLVMQGINTVGQLRREISIQGWNYDSVLNTIVVNEERELFFIITGSQFDRRPANKVVAFTFNGTNVWNSTTDSRTGSFDYGAQLQFADDQLAIVDPQNNRIALLSLSTGAFFGNTTIPEYIYVFAAVHAGGSWYRSEAQFDFRSTNYNITIAKYASDDGSLQQQYLLETLSDSLQLTEVLAVDDDGRNGRLYALQSSSRLASTAVQFWKLRPSDEEQHQTVAEDSPVRRVQSSGKQVLSAETNTPSAPVAGEGFDQLVEAIARRGGGRLPEWLKQMNATRAAAM